jgi:hypothetical protein
MSIASIRTVDFPHWRGSAFSPTQAIVGVAKWRFWGAAEIMVRASPLVAQAGGLDRLVKNRRIVAIAVEFTLNSKRKFLFEIKSQ